MGTALSVLLVILKCIGILLLIVLALLIIVLITPAGVDILWEPSRYTVHARFGPVRYRLMPRDKKEKKKKEKPAEPEQDKQRKNDSDAQKPGDEQAAKAVPKINPKKAVEAEKQNKQQDGGLQSDIKGSIQSILNDLRGDPFGTIQRLMDEFAPLLGRLLRGIHIRHLRVLWTITGEDAAQTAIAYGRAITLSNIVLERVQELMDVKADSLRLEPDFANQMTEMRHLSCQITVRPCIILIIAIKLLWRFLHLREKKRKKR